MPTPVGRTSANQSGLSTTFTFTRACAVGNTLVLFIQHGVTGSSITSVTDNSSGTNTWTKLQSTNDDSATTQRNMDLWACKPTVAISSIVITCSAQTTWVVSAEDFTATTVLASGRYFGSGHTLPAIQTAAGGVLAMCVGYIASTAGTAQLVAAAPLTYEGLANVSTTQQESFVVNPTSAVTSQALSLTTNPTVGAVYASLYTPGANSAPTVSPGSAQTVTGSTATLSGTASDTGPISSATWALLSSTGATAPTVGATTQGGAGTTSMTATANVTGLVAGTHVFRLTASDGSLTGTGDVTIYVPAATVIPNRVIANAGGWVAVGAADLVAALSKTADDDTKYIESPQSPVNASVTLGFEPIAAGDETVPLKARYTGSGTFTCTAKLYSGTTLITQSPAPLTLTSAWTSLFEALSAAENQAVANRNDIRVELIANQT